jgi:hypothetical protein
LSPEDQKKVNKVEYKEKELHKETELPEESLKLLDEIKKKEQEEEEREKAEKNKKKEEMKKKIEEAKRIVEEKKKEKENQPQEEEAPKKYEFIELDQTVDPNAPKIYTAREKKLMSDFKKELAPILYDNPNDDKVIQTLTLLKSIIKNSTSLNEKYRSINPTNKKIEEFIIKPEGGTSMLKFLGFEFQSKENIYLIEKGKMDDQTCEILTMELESFIENPKWKTNKKEIAQKRLEKKLREEEKKKVEEKLLEDQKRQQAQEIYDKSFLEKMNEFSYSMLSNGRDTEPILETLIKIIVNVQKEDDKYRHIKLTNEKIKKIILQSKGVLDFMKFIGFTEDSNQLSILKDVLSNHQIELIVNELQTWKSSGRWIPNETVTVSTTKTSNTSKPTTTSKKSEPEKKFEKKVEKIDEKKNEKKPAPINTTSQVPKKDVQPSKSPSEIFQESKKEPKKETKKGFFSGLFGWASGDNGDVEDLKKK